MCSAAKTGGRWRARNNIDKGGSERPVGKKPDTSHNCARWWVEGQKSSPPFDAQVICRIVWYQLCWIKCICYNKNLPLQQSKYKGLLNKTQWQWIAAAIKKHVKNHVADLEGGAGVKDG